MICYVTWELCRPKPTRNLFASMVAGLARLPSPTVLVASSAVANRPRFPSLAREFAHMPGLRVGPLNMEWRRARCVGVPALLDAAMIATLHAAHLIIHASARRIRDRQGPTNTSNLRIAASSGRSKRATQSEQSHDCEKHPATTKKALRRNRRHATAPSSRASGAPELRGGDRRTSRSVAAGPELLLVGKRGCSGHEATKHRSYKPFASNCQVDSAAGSGAPLHGAAGAACGRGGQGVRIV